MMCTNKNICHFLILPLLLTVLCPYQRCGPVMVQAVVRGEQRDNRNNNNNRYKQKLQHKQSNAIREDVIAKQASHERRRLFGERLTNPNNPPRGGAAGAAKTSVEFVPMRECKTCPTSPPTNPSPTSPPPSLPPTLDPANRNDRCERAKGPVEVTAQGLGNSWAVIYEDTTVGAQIPDVTPDRCGSLTNTAPGVWYSVIGTGDLMTASLCWPGTNFDSKITIYSGDCNSVMACEAVNDDASGNFGACQINLQASRVSWTSERGTMYYMLIHGFGGRAGDFQLNVLNRNPLNDRCENAESIAPGDLVIGTTFQASFPFDGDSGNCNDEFGLIGEANSVWYSIQGTGGTLEASTCNPNTADNFDTKLHIFSGGCDINDCLIGNDNYQSPGRCSLITWDTQAGQVYYIMVHGFLTSNGLFELSVRSV